MAEKKKPEKKEEGVGDLIRRLVPGQLGKDLIKKVTDTINKATGQDE